MTEPSQHQHHILNTWQLAHNTLTKASRTSNIAPTPSDILRLALWLDGADHKTVASTLTDVHSSRNTRG